MLEDEYDSDCSMASDYGLLKKALPFDCTVPANFDPNKVPQTAEEFLQYASYERSKLKPWTFAEIDPSKLTATNYAKFAVDDVKNSVSPEFLPSHEWQQKKLEEFIEFRNFVQSKMKNTLRDDFKETHFKDNFRNQTPIYADVIQYSQASKIRALELINDHLDGLDIGSSFEFNVGCWIYTILSLLDLPLHSDDCHTVRNIAKKCIVLRSNYRETDRDKYDPLNLFICLVSKFYRQLDLSDP